MQKKFVLTRQKLDRIFGQNVRGVNMPIAVANDLSTLMKSVENFAQTTLGVRNPNLLEWGEWKVSRHAKRAGITVTSVVNGAGVHFSIYEVDLLD